MRLEPKKFEHWKSLNLPIRVGNSDQVQLPREDYEAAAEAIPALVNEVERLRALVARYAIQPNGTGRECRACGQVSFGIEPQQHFAGCEVVD